MGVKENLPGADDCRAAAFEPPALRRFCNASSCSGVAWNPVEGALSEFNVSRNIKER